MGGSSWVSAVVFTLVSGAGMAQSPPTPVPAATSKLEPETSLPRETPIENSLGRAGAVSGSAFGGYGEITFNSPSNNTPSTVDLRRFVLYFGHDFNEHIRFYSEVEIEHAIASSSDKGEV